MSASFQSLSGFLIRCDAGAWEWLKSLLGIEFQSLSGFLISCDSMTLSGISPLSQFQSLSGFLISCDGPGYGLPQNSSFILFQSLSGFLISCDPKPAGEAYALPMFQSLSGFLISCDSVVPRDPANMDVSIPIGFSHQLRLFDDPRTIYELTRFNPYRVFSSAATTRGRV